MVRKKKEQPFKHPKLNTSKKKSSRTIPDETHLFSDLAIRLEDQIGSIETHLQEVMDIMKHDIHDSIKEHQFRNQDQLIKKEIQSLAKQLEVRINKTLDDFFQIKKLSRNQKKEIQFLKSMADTLANFLSLDFYKAIIDRFSYEALHGEVDDFGMDPKYIESIKPFFDFLYHKYWRVKTTGIENIPDKGRGLIVGNHSGTVPYDGSMIKTAILNEHPIRHDARFLVEDFVYHMPVMGTFMYRIGGVRACPENAQLLLEAEHLVVVFPEGVKGIGKHFSQRYQLQRMGRGGFIKLCMKTKSPLIPVGIVGAEEIHPIIFKSNVLAKAIGVPYIPITPTFPLLGLLGLMPLPTKWHIHFGQPIEFDHYKPQDMQNDLLIHKLSENVRGEIQSIVNELLENRQSIWLG